MLIGLFIVPEMSAFFAIGFVLFFGTILWTLALSEVPKQVWQAVWKAPLFVLKQITALFKMGNPNKNFKHTEHNRNVSIDDLVK